MLEHCLLSRLVQVLKTGTKAKMPLTIKSTIIPWPTHDRWVGKHHVVMMSYENGLRDR